jgi:uncharacterized delta-60 repeat protein
MREVIAALVLLLCLLAFPAGSAAAAPGDLDRSFGERGSVDILGTAALQAGAFEMAIGSNGAIFLLGRDPCGTHLCGRELVVSRFRSDGSLLGSYGEEGAATAFPGLVGVEGDPHMAIDSQDRAVIVAQHVDGGEPWDNVIVARLNPNGVPDPAFGGVRRLNTYSRSNATPLALAVSPDDRLLVGSSWVEPGGRPGSVPPTGLLFGRLLTDGSLDPGFASSGSLLFWVPGPSFFFDALALGRDGVATVAGNTCCSERPAEPILVRIQPDGASIDPKFGSEIWGPSLRRRLGVPASYSTTVKALSLRRNGRLDVIVTSEKERGRAERFSHLLRVSPEGRLDKRFGKNGIEQLPIPVDAAAVDAEGRTFAVDRSEGEGLGRALYGFRLKPNGNLDPTFGGGLVLLRKAVPKLDFYYRTDPIVAFAGQRPLVFERGSAECRPGFCDSPPFLIRLRGGASAVRCLGKEATIVGTARGETLNGTKRPDVIAGLGGADKIRGKAGDDLICGGSGRDKVNDGPGHDRVRR